jgi:ribosomal protein S15P/S13E
MTVSSYLEHKNAKLAASHKNLAKHLQSNKQDLWVREGWSGEEWGLRVRID